MFVILHNTEVILFISQCKVRPSQISQHKQTYPNIVCFCVVICRHLIYNVNENANKKVKKISIVVGKSDLLHEIVIYTTRAFKAVLVVRIRKLLSMKKLSHPFSYISQFYLF